jgi:Bacterial Ig domain/Cadherin-like domain
MKSRFVNFSVACLALLLLVMPLHAQTAASPQKAAAPGVGPVQWRASFNTGANMMHKNVFPGVDLIFSGSAIRINAQLIVQPGANLDAIRLDLSTVANLKIGPEVSAQLSTDKLALRLQVQEIFQAVKGEKQNLAGSFVQHEDGSVGIAVPEGYNPKQPLIIILVAIFQPATVQSPAAALSKSSGGASVNSPPPPVATTITATKTDQVIPDADNNGQAFPGETIKYTVTIQNTGSADATNTVYNDLIDPNTTFTPGSLKMTPLAFANNYNTQPNTTISRSTSDPDDLLDNDNPGIPAATIASFGGGNLGGAVTGHAAGSTVTPLPSYASGSLTVNANGSFTFTPPTGFTGNYTFDYRLTNSAGSSDATVSFAVQAAPSAVADNYFTPVNTTLSRSTSDPDDLLDNDNLGSPAATLTSFGGGSLGGIVTTNAAGASVALAGGTLTVNANGSFTLTTPTVPGSYTFQYRLTNVSGTSDATVTIEVRQAPSAVADSYNMLVNGTLTINTSDPNDLLDNDTRGFPLATINSFGAGSLGGAITDHAAGSSTALAGGTLLVNSDGSFSLTSPTSTGSFTFDYRITNSSGTSDATVTIEVRKAPTAVNDGPYTVSTGGSLTINTSDLNDLLDNDDRGFPLATIIKFGGGSLGGLVTDNNAGGPGVTLAGGTLTVGTDGSFSLATPTTAGSYTFQYRLSNVVNSSDATVTINVQGPPEAANDPNGGLPSNSTPSNDGTVVGTDHPYHTALNTTLTVPDGSDDLLANDNLGFPVASIISYGTTGSPGTQTSIGSSTPTNQGGSVTVQANGSFSYTPPSATFTGLDQFAYVIDNGTTPSTATVTVAVGVRPAAVADSRTATGNIRLSTATNLFTNDAGDQIMTVAFDATSVEGGNVTVSANGDFIYNPPPGYEGSDSFTYTVGNGFGNAPAATVTITVSGMIWFINNTAGVGDGRLTSPFNSLAAFNGINDGIGNHPAASDNIFIYAGSGSYTGGVTLLNNQKLIGDGSSTTLATITGITLATGSDALPTFSGTDPVIENAGGNGITLASGNTIRGLTVGNTPTGFGYSGGAVGTFNIQEASKTGTGGALNISTSGAAGTVQFDNLSSTNAPSQAINLVSVTGTISVTAGLISNPTGTAVSVSGGSVSMTYPGNITQSNNATTVAVTNGHTGTLTFQTGTISVTNGTGLQFDNAAGTYNFNGTATLNGGDAGIDILNGQANSGTFTFGAGTSITNPSGTAFNVNGDANAINYNGSISQSNNAAAVMITNHSSPNSFPITFGAGSSISATNGTGLQFDNADNTYNFDGTATLNGGDAGIDIVNNSGGKFNFGSGVSITSPSGTALNVNSFGVRVNFHGSITQANNAAAVSIANNIASGPGSIFFAESSIIATNGTGLQFDNADGSYNFDGTVTLNGGDAGIDILNGSTGTFTFGTGTSITRGNSVTGEAFNLLSSDANVTYNGSMTLGTSTGNMVAINNHDAGTITFNTGTLTKGSSTTQGISIQNSNGGSINFNNPTITITMTSGKAVSLTNNASGTINFNISGGGSGMDLTTTSDTGFNATGGGTIAVTGAGNSITSTTGTALNVVSTDIGASNLNFQSISAGTGAGSAGNGIVLDNTGTNGGLIITGSGSAGSGGTIQHKTGSDGTTTGIGIYLNSTKNPSLAWMQLNDFDNFAIRGFSVNGFTMSNTVINGTNGNSATQNEGSVSFGANTGEPGGPANGLTGSASVTSCNISGAFEDNFRVANQSGSLNRITFDATTIGANSTTDGNDGLLIEGESSATINVTVQNSFFTSARADLFNLILNGNNTSDLIFTGNTLTNNHPAIATGGGGVTIVSGNNVASGANFTFNMSGNSFRDADGHAVLIVKSTDPGTVSGTFANNTIGVAATANSGSAAGSGLKVQNAGLGTITIAITGNQIRQYNNFGIELLTGGGATAYSGNLNATITGNTVSNPGTGGLPMNGIHLNGGTVPGDTYQICANIGGAGALANSITGSGANGGTDFRLRQRQSTTVKLPGYVGANTDDTAVVTFVAGQQLVGASGLASHNVPPGGGFVGGAACPTP